MCVHRIGSRLGCPPPTERGLVWVCTASSRPGIAGAVQQLQLHPTAPLLASVGLDRFFRLHDVATRTLVKKVCRVPTLACGATTCTTL